MFAISDEITWKSYLADLIWTSLSATSRKVRGRDQINFRCPICGDSRKSLTKKRGFYYISTASYHCFNCEANMSGLSLLKRIAPENIYHDAIVQYNNMKLASLGIKGTVIDTATKDSLIVCNPIPAWKILCNEYDWKSPTALTKDALDYLKSRAIDDSQLSNFLSIVSPKGVPYILILYRYNGDCIFYQLHNYTKFEVTPGQVIKYLFPDKVELNDQEKPIFNIDNIDPTWGYIIGCEGVYDALSYKNGISFGGRTITDYQWQLLRERWPHHKLVMAFDNDDAGKKAMMKFASKCNDGDRFLNLFSLFDHFHVKDANDFIQLGEKAKTLLKNKEFLEKNMVSALEMKVNLLVN